MFSAKKYSLSAVLMLVLLTACGGHLYHRVEPGETLYSIGWVYGYDYRQIARWNNIESPYVLSPGQRIRVAPPSGQSSYPLQEYRESTASDEPVDKSSVVQSAKTPAPVIEAGEDKTSVVDKSSYVQSGEARSNQYDGQSVISAAKTAVKKLFNQTGDTEIAARNAEPHWRWPTEEKRILRTFSANNPSRQGLDIAGAMGAPVKAAAAGRVVYAGSGLVRYGRLIIIKHNEKFLSAYAHNQKLRVKEGDEIKAGQQIADMGRSGNPGANVVNGKRAKLHFEIRRNGEPVDPLRYLPK